MNRIKRNGLCLLIIIFAGSSSFGFSQTDIGVLVDYNKTSEVKKRIQQKDKNYLPAYRALIEKAEVAMNEGPFSVMYKNRTPPSGDKHDYMSLGSYWWPDCERRDKNESEPELCTGDTGKI